MAECKPDEKPIDQPDLSSISNILKIILGAFNMMSKPAQSIPPPLNFVGARLKPGMSPRNLSARKLQKRSAIGLTEADVFEDGPNREAQAIVADDKELHNEIVNNMSVQSEFGPGSVIGTITGAAGPVPVVGTFVNTGITSLKGSAK